MSKAFENDAKAITKSADPPGLRVDPSSFPPFLLILSYSPEPPTPRGEVYLPLTPLLGPTPALPNWTRALVGLPLIGFYRFLASPNWHRKIYEFLDHRKTAQMAL